MTPSIPPYSPSPNTLAVLVPVYMLEVLKKQVQATEQLRQDNELLKQRIEALEKAIQSNQLLDFKEVGK